jgi:hypothetical protein
VFYLLTRNLVLDNHTMELGIQGFSLLCKIARKREEETTLCSVPESSILTFELPLWEKLHPKLHTSHLKSQRFMSFC